ncbi:MAG: serine hydroxymethyltransferase [Nitrososphaerota archaeon]
MDVAGMDVLRLVTQHNRYRGGCLNLIASENIISRAVLKALATDLASRYAFRPEFYGGTRYANMIWDECEALAREVFKAEYCTVAPLSGHLALMIALATVVPKGDEVACIPTSEAGYPGMASDKLPEALGLRVFDLPYHCHSIDVGSAVKLISEKRPAAVVLGASLILYPHPIRELAEATHRYGGRIIYDGSHVMGLIAGGQFQDPLDEGADILLGSTHKSFFGPQGGLIATNDGGIARELERNIFHKFVDNIHLNRVAALAVALEEMRRYARDYAKRVVSNAKALAVSLDAEGLGVFKSDRGYTESHQVYIPMGPMEGAAARDKLERSRIIVDMAVRLGTGEVSRRGMSAAEMRVIARFIARGMSGEDVTSEVARLVAKFRRLRYALEA